MPPILPLLLSLLAILPPAFSAPQCGDQCRFTFCKSRPLARITAPNLPATKPICLSGLSNLRVASTGEAIIKLRGRRSSTAKKASSLGNGTLPREVLHIENGDDGPRIVASMYPPLLHRTCAVLPIRKYRGQDARGRVVKGGGGRMDCVAFEVRVSTAEVRLEWDSNDDVDVFVKNPAGAEVSFARRKGMNGGKLLKDANRGRCARRKVGMARERVLYAGKKVLKGAYSVKAEHTRLCETGAKWRISVWVRGLLERRVEGFSMQGGGEVIEGSTIGFLI